MLVAARHLFAVPMLGSLWLLTLALLAFLGLGAHARARERLPAYLPALVLGGLALAVALTL